MRSEGYCVRVCPFDISPLERIFVLKTIFTYSTGNEGQNNRVNTSETAPLQRSRTSRIVWLSIFGHFPLCPKTRMRYHHVCYYVASRKAWPVPRGATRIRAEGLHFSALVTRPHPRSIRTRTSALYIWLHCLLERYIESVSP